MIVVYRGYQKIVFYALEYEYECFVMQMLYACVLCAFCDSINAAFCMTCSLLMLVEDARDDHTEEASTVAGLMTALPVVRNVSFCLYHAVAVSDFIIRRGLCACTEML